MAASQYDITIEQGATFTLNIDFKDGNDQLYDLSSGYTGRMKIRHAVGGDIIDSSEPEDSPNNNISITLGTTSSSSPNIVVSISAEKTAAYTFDTGVYDLELVAGTNVDRIVQGRIKLDKEVTV